MSFRVVDIDHLMIRVANLDRGVEMFKALGFTVAPPRKLFGIKALEGSSASSGNGDAPPKPTINHRHILFQPYPGRVDTANFLELMAIEDQLHTPPHLTQMLCFLLDSEGPKTVVCLADDLEQAREDMIAAGIETSPPIPLETGWEDEETGEFVRVSGAPLVPVFGQTPFMTNPCIHNLPESLRHEPWTRHPNGALYLAGVTGVTEDIEEDARLMSERVYGVDAEWDGGDVAEIRPRDLVFRMLTPDGFARTYPGLDYSRERVLPAYCAATIAVESLDRVRIVLNENGVEHTDLPGGRVAVPRQHAANTIIEFVEHAAG
jgi:hypothetical protein